MFLVKDLSDANFFTANILKFSDLIKIFTRKSRKNSQYTKDSKEVNVLLVHLIIIYLYQLQLRILIIKLFSCSVKISKFFFARPDLCVMSMF